MEIVRFERGALAPPEADFIRVDTHRSGWNILLGSVGGMSVDVVDLGVHETSLDAEAEGLRWATSKGARTLYIETGRSTPSVKANGPTESTQIDG